MGEGQTPHRPLDPCLQGLLRGTPGEDRISRALTLAQVYAIEQLEAITASILSATWREHGSKTSPSLENRSEADIIADKLLRVAAHQAPEEWKTSIGKDERERVSLTGADQASPTRCGPVWSSRVRSDLVRSGPFGLVEVLE